MSIEADPLESTNVLARQADRMARRKREARKRLLIRIGIALLAVAVIAVVGFNCYKAQLNDAVSTDDAALLESLAAHGENEPFYLLLLGVDKGEERYGTEGTDPSNYRSDTIMLCRIDPVEVKATIVSIHRDLLSELPDGTMGKINATYSLEGPSGMVRAISNLAGVDIHHYAEVDFDSFMGIVDAIGGVEVTLPVAISDPEYTELELPAGTQVLNGHDALMLSRTRHAYDEYGDGDVFRAANQRMVIAAIVRKVLASDPATMIAAVSSMAESVTTDMSVDDILSLAAKMRDFDPNTDMYTAMTPSEPVVIDDIYYEELDEDTWDHMMERVRQGLPPYDSDEQDETRGIAGSVSNEDQGAVGSLDAQGADAAQDADGSRSANDPQGKPKKALRADVHVDVFSIEGGGAVETADLLSGLGCTAEALEDPSYYIDANVVVYEDPDLAEDAQAIADALDGEYEVILNDGNWVQSDDIVVRIASW